MFALHSSEKGEQQLVHNSAAERWCLQWEEQRHDGLYGHLLAGLHSQDSYVKVVAA